MYPIRWIKNDKTGSRILEKMSPAERVVTIDEKIKAG
jgi:hypothetical protein